MAHKQSDENSTDASLESLAALLIDGYTDEVRSFTESIRANPKAVIHFEAIFDILIEDGHIQWRGTLSQETSMRKVESSLEEMESFLDGMGSPYKSYMTLANHGHEITFETGWQDQRGSVVWDRWTTEVDDPVMAFANAGFLFDLKDYLCIPKPSEKPEPPLYRYHPERFKAYRDYAESVGKFYRQKVEPVSGMLTFDQLNEVMPLMVSELNQRSMHFPRKLKDSHPAPSLVLETESTLATAYGRFVQAGRQIMDFPLALIEMLAKTDVDDIALNSIKMPYASQYLHFGPRADLEIEPGWLVDGAYVESRGVVGDVRFTVTAVPSDCSLSKQWYLFPEAEYTQDFVGEFRTMDLATAIDTVLSEKLVGLRETEAKAGGNITSMVKQQFNQEETPFPENLTLVDVSPKLAAQRLDISARRHPVYREALQLVVNALCYVAAYPEDIDTVWPTGTPDSLVQKVLHGKGKEQMRAKSKLTALGYVPVHICGKQIAEQRAAHAIQANEHGHVGVHWRRGHWRNQVHGPARSLRKLIWVMPIVVGAKNRDEPETGHIYLVS